MEGSNSWINSLLVSYDFIIDMDTPMIQFVKDTIDAAKSIGETVPEINKIANYKCIDFKKSLIQRLDPNPLTLLINDKEQADEFYENLKSGDYDKELITKYKPSSYNTFNLMQTYLSLVDKLTITVLCKNQHEATYIKLKEPKFKILICDRKDVNTEPYTVIYEKYYENFLQYKNLCGKHLYAAKCGFNLDEGKLYMPLMKVSIILGDINSVHLMDLYTEFKYKEELK